MSDIKITIGADITNLQSNLAKAGGVTQDYANKATAASAKVGASYQSLFNLTEKLRVLQSNVFTEKDRAKISAYNVQIKATEAEIAKLNGLGVSGGGLGAIGTGATKAYSALRNLAYIIPGIGISGIVAFATEPIINYISSLFGASEATKKLAEENKKFAESLDEVRAKGTATGIELQNFVAIARDQKQSLSTRNEALKEANKIMGEHGEKLTLLNIGTAAVTEEINKFTQASIAQAVALKYVDRIADLIVQQNNATKKYTASLNEQAKAQAFAKTQQDGSNHTAALSLALLSEESSKRKKAADEYKAITQQIIATNADLYKAQLSASQGFGDVGFKIKPAKVTIEPQTVKFKMPVGGANDIVIPVRIAFADIGSEVGKGIAKGGTAGAIADKLIGGSVDDVTAEVQARMDQIAKNTNKIFEDTLVSLATDSVTTIFEGIANIATGKGGIGDMFKGLGHVLGAGIKQLGQSVLKIAILAQLAKKAITNPFTGIAAGIALIALGTALEAATSKNAFASGTRNFQGGSALVGERGPERIFLPQGSSVQPNNELNAYGGNGITLQPSISYSGTEFRIFLNRVDAQMRRNN